MRKVGLIGCGVIGSTVVAAIQRKEIPNVQLVGILSRSSNAAIEQAQQVLGARFVRTIQELIALAPDVVLEAAGQEAVFACGQAVVGAGIDLLPMSVGALADHDFRTALIRSAKQHGAAIWIPSGAIGALDVLRAGRSLGELEEVVLTSTKKPAALMNSRFVLEQGMDLSHLEKPLTVAPSNICRKRRSNAA